MAPGECTTVEGDQMSSEAFGLSSRILAHSAHANHLCSAKKKKNRKKRDRQADMGFFQNERWLRPTSGFVVEFKRVQFFHIHRCPNIKTMHSSLHSAVLQRF